MSTGKVPQTLTPTALLKLWESVRLSTREFRAQTIMYNSLPERERDEIMSWCIGECDAFLLKLYCSMFGNYFDCITSCPACTANLELTLAVDDLLTKHGSGRSTYQLTFGEPPLVIFFRLPNRDDIQQIHVTESRETLRKLMVERCVLHAKQEGEKISPVPLTEQAIAAVIQAMSIEDPQAENLLNMKCPDCQHEWQTLFDIVDFLWQKINSEAKRLMTEIHILAQAYGWTESEILALPKERRKIYLELAG